jgi:hypothetical protein
MIVLRAKFTGENLEKRIELILDNQINTFAKNLPCFRKLNKP